MSLCILWKSVKSQKNSRIKILVFGVWCQIVIECVIVISSCAT